MKIKRNTLITWLVIIAVIILGIVISSRGGSSNVPEEIAKCIGEKSTLYVQLGCPHCKTQEDMFGNNKKYLEEVDCFYERIECQEKDIQATPTWIISGEYYEGVQSIERLQELTGC